MLSGRIELACIQFLSPRKEEEEKKKGPQASMHVTRDLPHLSFLFSVVCFCRRN